MNNPLYRLLKNRYSTPTTNAGAPSPSSENSGTVCVEAVGVWVAGTTVIDGCQLVGVAFTCLYVAFTTLGVGVAVAAGVALPAAAWMAVTICCSVTAPTSLCPPLMTIVGVPVTPFAAATPCPSDVSATLYSMSLAPVCAAALSTSGFTCSQMEHMGE